MRTLKWTVLTATAVWLAACAAPTTYMGSDDETRLQESFGFSQQKMEDDIWRIRFKGSTGTNLESVQTYWLYHCADFALKKGYDGFEIISNVQFIGIPTTEQNSASGNAASWLEDNHVPGWTEQSPNPALEADVRLLRAPITPAKRKVFDAAAIKSRLEPLVTKFCDGGNVCHHNHDYLE